MKVIFLDIDGVLNYAGCKSKIGGIYFVEDEKIKLLKQLVDRTGAKIVLSSTWCIGWFDLEHGYGGRNADDFLALTSKLKEYGLELISRTPIFGDTDCRRGREIDSWLKSWNGDPVESFVILDDVNGRELRPHSSRHIRTSFNEGLRQKHIDRAVKLLEQQ